MGKIGPLTGIRVLDLSRYLPGMLCSQMLADFGAEVINIEEIKDGASIRTTPPFIDGTGAGYYTCNRNKRSMTLDLKAEQGKAIFKKLAQQSDIVIDPFRPGVMNKLGLGYDELKGINDRLIYCAVTGYGTYGPMRDVAGHDVNYLSLSGIIEMMGRHKEMPAIPGVQIADIVGGSLFSVIAILMALAARSQTGRGQFCDVSLMDGALTLMTYVLGEWSAEGILPQRGSGVLSGGYAFYQNYETKDNRYVCLGALEEKFWRNFCEAIGHPEYIEKQWDKSIQKELIAEVQAIISQKNMTEWVESFAKYDMCFSPALNMEEIMELDHFKEREMLFYAKNVKGSGKDVAVVGVPFKLSDTPGETKMTFSTKGEHTDEILTSQGFSAEEIKNFRANGII